MKILLIEDDIFKADHIRELISEVLPAAAVATARSYQSALRCLIDNRPDRVILDMTLPTFDIESDERGGRIRPFAGYELLIQMELRGITVRTLVLTQFEEFGDEADRRTLEQLRNEVADQFPSAHGGGVEGFIFYSPAQSDWRVAVSRFLTS